MILFAQYEFLWLLLLVPLLPALYGVSRALRRRRLLKLGEEGLVKVLMPSYSGSKGWVRIILFDIAFAFFVIGLARPQIGAKLTERETRGAEIMIALDVSNSMLAEDYSPNRLERSKLAISRIVDKLAGDRVGLVVFAGQAFFQLPITADYVSAKIFLSSINTESVPIQGTALAEALTSSAKSFSTQSSRSRAIILITDGEDHEGDVQAAAQAIADEGIRIYCIGVGSPQGKPIPKNGELMKDANGEIVVSRLDEAVLQEIAGIGGGKYVRAGNSEFGLNPIIDDIREMDKEQFQSLVFEDFNEQYMYLFAIALFFLILEMLVSDNRLKHKLFKDRV